MIKKYLQFGCGLSNPSEFINVDASPTLYLQRLKIGAFLFKRILKPKFPSNVIYGDIVMGLKGIELASLDGVYSSHVLEHLSLEDCKKAINNSFLLLKKGGIFRCVLPNLENQIDIYKEELKTEDDELAAINFNTFSGLGTLSRPKGFKGFIKEYFGASKHLWMWDYPSLSKVIKDAGFMEIREGKFNDSIDPMFNVVEDQERFKWNALVIEAIK